MSKLEYYLAKAEDALALAELFPSPMTKRSFLQAAEAWRLLARLEREHELQPPAHSFRTDDDRPVLPAAAGDGDKRGGGGARPFGSQPMGGHRGGLAEPGEIAVGDDGQAGGFGAPPEV